MKICKEQLMQNLSTVFTGMAPNELFRIAHFRLITLRRYPVQIFDRFKIRRSDVMQTSQV